MDSNHRSKMQQIYSLPPLATREPFHPLYNCIGRFISDSVIITSFVRLVNSFFAFFLYFFQFFFQKEKRQQKYFIVPPFVNFFAVKIRANFRRLQNCLPLRRNHQSDRQNLQSHRSCHANRRRERRICEDLCRRVRLYLSL